MIFSLIRFSQGGFRCGCFDVEVRWGVDEIVFETGVCVN